MTLEALVFLLSAFLMCYDAGAINQSQLNSNTTAKSSTRCLKSLQDIEQVLSSNVPPIEGFTDNYHSIKRALFPGVNSPSLYIKVTIQFVNDTENQTTKKFTWSESCIFVYTKDIGLTAMSFYSLGTILPQRRQRELVITLPEACDSYSAISSKNNFEDENDMWKYVLSTLQDIAITPNVSDPRVNTAMCVVSGHEGDPKDPIDYPSAWYKSCWWKFAASLVTSIFVCWLMHNWIKKNWKNTDNNKLFKTMLKTLVLIYVITILLNIIIFFILFWKSAKLYSFVTAGTVIPFVLIPPFINLIIKICKCKCADESGNNCFYSFAGVLMFPCVFLMIHHLMWILCGGIIADPSWAIPVLLGEGIIFCASVYAIHIFQGDSKNGKASIIVHLILGVVSLIFIIGTVVMSSYGQTVIIPTTGIIEIIALAMIAWFIKKLGLINFLGTGAGNDTGDNARNC